jgi:diaphanous 1
MLCCALVSFPTLQQNVKSLLTSLDKVKEEISLLKQIRTPSDNDRFVTIMQVNTTEFQRSSRSDARETLAVYP